MVKQSIFRSLYFQVLVAIAIGVVLGHYYPETGAAMKPLGDGFIKLIKMIIAPIIFCTIVVGIAGMKDMKKVGKTGGYALLYFEIVSTFALIIGLVVVNVWKPGAGMNVDVSTLDSKSVAMYAAPGKMVSTTDFIMNIIPTSVVDAFAKGDILQVLFFSILFGYALHAFGERGRPVFEFIEKTSHILFGIIGLIMKVAPIGAFGAIAYTIGKHGLHTLAQLAHLMGSFYLTCVIFVALVLGSIARMHGFSLWKLLKYIKEELFIVLGTSSSESALPRLIAKMENAGAEKSVVGMVVPTGYSFNLDGTSIYLTMVDLHRPGNQHPARPRPADRPPDRPAAHFEGRGGGRRRRLHRPGRNAVLRRRDPGRRPGADPRHRPLHVGSPLDHQLHRQQRRHAGRRQVVQRARHGSPDRGAQRRNRRRGRPSRTRAQRRRGGDHAAAAAAGRRSSLRPQRPA